MICSKYVNLSPGLVLGLSFDSFSYLDTGGGLQFLCNGTFITGEEVGMLSGAACAHLPRDCLFPRKLLGGVCLEVCTCFIFYPLLMSNGF